MPPEEVAASSEQVHHFCGSCHAYPPPDTFPRSVWRREVKQGYDFYFKNPRLRLDPPSLESVALYYERRAPESFPPIKIEPSPQPPPVRFERRGFSPPGQTTRPGVANVNLVHLFDDRRLDVLVCDALRDQVLVLKPYEQPPAWQTLVKSYCCVHAEVIDLDGDGIKDVLLACIGRFYATDDKVGSVVWLKGAKDGTFTPITLLEGVGRVADVQAADFQGKGKKDLVVAVFGWRTSGEVLYLENKTTDWNKPVFERHVLDDRHGAVHVPVGDLNGDGKPDIAVLLSQEHETVVVFLNEGNGKFRKETIYAAPHPTFGSNGIQLIDMNGDGRLDVLYTNGDSLDAPYLLKPYHGVQWLENKGKFPFEHHRLADMYGISRAVAADFAGTGRLDVAAVSYLPGNYFPQRDGLNLDAVALLEQAAPGKFLRHTLEAATCDHLTCAVGDVYGDGKPDLVVGNSVDQDREIDAVVIWKNLGRK
jgi:hypothetical protein